MANVKLIRDALLALFGDNAKKVDEFLSPEVMQAINPKKAATKKSKKPVRDKRKKFIQDARSGRQGRASSTLPPKQAEEATRHIGTEDLLGEPLPRARESDIPVGVPRRKVTETLTPADEAFISQGIGKEEIKSSFRRPSSFRARGRGEGFNPDDLESKAVRDTKTGQGFEHPDPKTQANIEFAAENADVNLNRRQMEALQGRSLPRPIISKEGVVTAHRIPEDLTLEQQFNREMGLKARRDININQAESVETGFSADTRIDPGVVAKGGQTQKQVDQAIDSKILASEKGRGVDEGENISGPSNLVHREGISKDAHLDDPKVQALMQDLDIARKQDEELLQEMRDLFIQLSPEERSPEVLRRLAANRAKALEADIASKALHGPTKPRLDSTEAQLQRDKHTGRDVPRAVAGGDVELTVGNLGRTLSQKTVRGKPIPENQKAAQQQSIKRFKKEIAQPAAQASARSGRKKAKAPILPKDLDKFPTPKSGEIEAVRDKLLGLPGVQFLDAPENAAVGATRKGQSLGLAPEGLGGPTKELTSFQQQLMALQQRKLGRPARDNALKNQRELEMRKPAPMPKTFQHPGVQPVAPANRIGPSEGTPTPIIEEFVKRLIETKKSGQVTVSGIPSEVSSGAAFNAHKKVLQATNPDGSVSIDLDELLDDAIADVIKGQ
jgi:hypothetical protein